MSREEEVDDDEEEDREECECLSTVWVASAGSRSPGLHGPQVILSPESPLLIFAKGEREGNSIPSKWRLEEICDCKTKGGQISARKGENGSQVLMKETIERRTVQTLDQCLRPHAVFASRDTTTTGFQVWNPAAAVDRCIFWPIGSNLRRRPIVTDSSFVGSGNEGTDTERRTSDPTRRSCPASG